MPAAPKEDDLKTITTAPPRPGRRRRQITSVLLALSLSVGMIVATPTPAYAATSVRGCFVLSGVGYPSDLWDMPVEVYAHTGTQLIRIGQSTLGPNGCQTFYISGFWVYLPVVMMVNARYPNGYYFGVTPIVAGIGIGHVELGTGQVTVR